MLTQSDTTANSQGTENALLNQLTHWKYIENFGFGCHNPQCTPIWIHIATEWSLLDQNFGTNVESIGQTKSTTPGLWENPFCVLKPVSACINKMSRLFVEKDNYGKQSKASGQRECLIRQISWLNLHTLRDPHKALTHRIIRTSCFISYKCCILTAYQSLIFCRCVMVCKKHLTHEICRSNALKGPALLCLLMCSTEGTCLNQQASCMNYW